MKKINVLQYSVILRADFSSVTEHMNDFYKNHLGDFSRGPFGYRPYNLKDGRIVNLPVSSFSSKDGVSVNISQNFLEIVSNNFDGTKKFKEIIKLFDKDGLTASEFVTGSTVYFSCPNEKEQSILINAIAKVIGFDGDANLGEMYDFGLRLGKRIENDHGKFAMTMRSDLGTVTSAKDYIEERAMIMNFALRAGTESEASEQPLSWIVDNVNYCIELLKGEAEKYRNETGNNV